ncbi:MAG: UDP-3-O-(3-hydroxymyristoyl)glucosamine N-acyltransferase [Rhodobacterales bacterium]|nr:MAG: UDP-3-O-(3-hydroxymyristoyl)glucosamine N-acyltransferase [Rhodobacterales bacterium]
MDHSLDDIAAALGATVLGDGALRVRAVAEPAMAGPDDLALAMSPAYADALTQGQARAAIVWPGADWQALGLSGAIEAPRARLALSKLTRKLDPDDVFRPGRHAMTAIDDSARIADDAWIGPFVEIGPGAQIGPGARIAGRVTIGAGAIIGADVQLHPGVVIQPRVRLGDRVTVHPGAVIGADGFSYVTETVSHPETVKKTGGKAPLEPPVGDASWHKIASLGAVEIADDVEIGANSTVDAGTIRPTRIGARTKLDNLVHIGHNCEIGMDCLICGQVGMAGSVIVGDRVVLAGQVGVADHHKIGSDVVAGGASKIMANVPSGRVVLGYPASRMDTALSGFKAVRRLSRKPVSKDGGRD